MKHTSVVVESQPDWLTAAVHSSQKVPTFKRLADDLLDGELRAGARVRPFRLQGYVGYQAGRVRYGERENAALVQLSGDLAAHNLSHVRFLEDSLTRIDLAVTARLSAPDAQVAGRHYNEANGFRLHHPRAARPQLVQDGDGGATCYLGERVSNYMLRVYNKQAERLSDHDSEGAAKYENCWRYELEVKGGPAPMMAKLIDESPNRADACQSYIHGFCVQHGLVPIFQPEGPRDLIPGFSRRSDRQRTLQWFRSSVGPSIQRLIGSGDPQEVYDALGLPPPFPPSQSLTQS